MGGSRLFLTRYQRKKKEKSHTWFWGLQICLCLKRSETKITVTKPWSFHTRHEFNQETTNETQSNAWMGIVSSPCRHRSRKEEITFLTCWIDVNGKIFQPCISLDPDSVSGSAPLSTAGAAAVAPTTLLLPPYPHSNNGHPHLPRPRPVRDHSCRRIHCLIINIS